MTGRGRHSLGLFVLVLAVVAAHGCVTSTIGDRMVADGAAPPPPPRLEVAYVREMNLAAPPVIATRPAAPAAAPPRVKSKAVAPKPAASAPEPAVEESVVAAAPVPEPQAVEALPQAIEYLPQAAEAPPLAAASEPQAALPVVAHASAAAETAAPRADPVSSPAAMSAAAPAASGAAGEAFEWPASTRLTYKVKGYFRGEVEGDAQVEWVRVGTHYQVHLVVSVGPSFAPLFSRRMTSDGEITAEGLAPQRYDQETQVVFRELQRTTLRFEPEAVVLANGERRERPPGVQDTTSQFVQLAYLFALQPELLRSGASIALPVVFPRRIERLAYDVREQEPVNTPFGALPAWHLVPRRELSPKGDLVIEMWLAPQLRYLPVRLRILQDAETWIDMVVSRKPELAAAP